MSDEGEATDHDRQPTDPTLRAIDLLAPRLEAAGLDELEVEVGDLRVRLARPRAASSPSPAAPTGAAATPTGAPPSPYGEPAPGRRFVTAPLTGVWYSAPSPGARPYVQVGDEIAAGQVVGLIEAMKLFNEIKTDVGGTLTRMLVESGTLVKRTQPLLEIELT